MTNQELAAAYRRMNGSKRRKLIWHLTDRGFTSEINNLLLAVLYCVVNETEFYLYSKHWNAAYRDGWEDYFLPFCEREERFLFYRPHATFDRVHQRMMYILQGMLLPGYMFSQDIWKRMRQEAFLDREFVIPELEIKGDIFHAKQVMLRLVYRFSEETAARVNDEIRARLDGSDSFLRDRTPYIAVHIRRGDKVKSRKPEAKRIHAGEFVRTIRELDTKISDVLISTDDYDAVQEFRAAAPSAWRILTFCPEDKNGYVQKDFRRLEGAGKKEEMIRLFADLELLSRAGVFVGTYSSNIGRFVALMRGGRNCYSLDKKWHPR